MAFTWDPIYTMNLMFCVVILVLGYWGYKKKGDKVPLCIGVAFSLFGFSHLTTLLGFKETLTMFLIIIRTFAYLIVIFTLYKYWKR